MKTQSKGGKVRFTFEVDPAVLDRFKLASKARHRSAGGELCFLVETRVAEFEAQVGEAA